MKLVKVVGSRNIRTICCHSQKLFTNSLKVAVAQFVTSGLYIFLAYFIIDFLLAPNRPSKYQICQLECEQDYMVYQVA